MDSDAKVHSYDEPRIEEDEPKPVGGLPIAVVQILRRPWTKKPERALGQGLRICAAQLAPDKES